MRTIESSGKTVEDAIKAGLRELGCDFTEVNQEVLDHGSPGLFGMFGRLAKVRLTVKEEDTDYSIDMPVLTLDPQTENKKASKKSAEKKPEEPVKSAPAAPAVKADAPVKPEPKPAQKPEAKPVAKTEAKSEDAPRPRKEKSERPRRERAPRKEAPVNAPVEETEAEATAEITVEPRVELPPLDLNALTESGRRAYDFLSAVTQQMGMEVEIRLLEEENHLTVGITGDTLGVLIGRRGETMDALQYLTSLNVNKDKSEYTRVTLDVENYRAKREETLRRLALRMANRAKKTGRRVVLEPMNPYERRVLHSALQNNPYVQTHSEGEEPYRRVIITLK